jgi:3-oxoacyl-[acyl-carrier-protein] synthase II
VIGEHHRRRAVITGIGVIAANGKTLKDFWKTIREGVSGCGPVTRYDVSGLPVKASAEVKDFRLEDHADVAKPQRLDLTVQYGLAAASEAVADSKLDLTGMNPDRVAVVEGTTTSGASNVLRVFDSMQNKQKIHPYHAIGGYCGEGSSAIGMLLGIHGHALTYCSGCASGNDAIGFASRSVWDDEVDVAIAGGSDAMFEAQHHGFCRLRAMSEIDAEPEELMRPFDRSRDGFVLGEGSAFFVIEEMTHAVTRGAHIYAEIIGHGKSCEAYHPTDPAPDARGYISAMRKALRDASILVEDIDYINAHGSATPLNDPLETKAIRDVFGPHAYRLGISGTKPITGHAMGAAGALEAAVCAVAIARREMPPTINLVQPDVGCDLDYVARSWRPYPIRAAMSINAGFGGRYACLLFQAV